MNAQRKLSQLGLAFLGSLAICRAAVAEPVARWSFGTEETARLSEHGGVHRDLPGPRPPEFPDFEPYNTAVKFDGRGARFVFADPGDDSPFDFTNGDAITLEAWVNMADVNKGENVYVVGKGRTYDPLYPKDNQNWALRIREAGGQARLSFLFATPPKTGEAKDGHWHRWTSASGFAAGTGWHHLAVSYRFGEPASVAGWLDGKPTAGSWDMGGATAEAPVVDNDAIWIGSSMGGSTSNSFRGMLDEIAIHREIIAPEVMSTRYRRVDSAKEAVKVVETAPPVKQIPAGRVLVTYQEGIAVQDQWPTAEGKSKASLGKPVEWLSDEFIFPRLPLRYDDWGIRQAWPAPVLMRAAADVTLEPGKRKFLLRARGLSRLWINGAVVARTGALRGTSDGYAPVVPVPDPTLPGLRPVGYGDQEAFGEIEIKGDGRCHVVLETIVGGKKYRPEPGEMCVAVQTTDGNSYVVLRPDGAGAPDVLTDAGWESATARAETSLAALDDTTRRTAAASLDGFWTKRHELAAQWAKAHLAPAVPVTQAKAAHPIDAFLASKIERALAASSGTAREEGKQFHTSVYPILSDQCFRCHGEKDKGDLRLNTREAALKGGASGHPAVSPGSPAASELVSRIRSTDPEERMPPKGDGLKPEQIAAIEAWVKAGAPWPPAPVSAEEVAAPPVIGDAPFLRRLYLDTVGVPPSEAEARAFLEDKSADKRSGLVDKLLTDDRFADQWISYWQDVLAENPSILKPTLNNTGPFRWFLYESIRDNKPLDRMVTELVMLRGGKSEGGSAGFGMAADNDAPLAAKGQILAGAFLGVELQCARCHDSPFHSTKQRDLYSLAAMMQRKSVTVPKTSRVPAAFFENKARVSLIKVTLKPDEVVTPVWPFEKTCGVADNHDLDTLLQDPADTRERLAALITAPQNQRFSRVIVNRVWKRLIGTGIVDLAHDWEGHAASHPELLDWLAGDFVAHGYDFKHLMRTILTSQLYQREAKGQNAKPGPDGRYFAAPERRRLTGEQVVDSLFAAAGKKMKTEELTFDPDGRRSADTFVSLGQPRRAWMFASLSNERDRPSLALPAAQAVTDVLEAFGWSGSRQNPRTDRETDPNVLQPGTLENSVMSLWVTRASADSGLTKLAIEAASPEALVDSIFLRFLTRLPRAEEREHFAKILANGFADRLLVSSSAESIAPPSRLPRVSWSNHLIDKATDVKLEMEKRARAGDPPDSRLRSEWRETYEDFVWGVINSPEFVWVP